MTTQSERAYQQLRTDILNGTLQPGYPLLEQELAERLGMSRTPVRAAVARLKTDGLVETIRRKGIFVRPLTAEDVEQMYEMMEGLEGMAVKLAATRATEADLDQLQSLADEMGRAVSAGDLDAWVKADVQFHKLLHGISRNKYIDQQLKQLDLHVERVRWLLFRIQGSTERSTSEHQMIVEAMRLREGDRARMLHQAHWQRVRGQIVDLLRHGGFGIPRLNPVLTNR